MPLMSLFVVCKITWCSVFVSGGEEEMPASDQRKAWNETTGYASAFDLCVLLIHAFLEIFKPLRKHGYHPVSEWE
jgi:hypothetical protein